MAGGVAEGVAEGVAGERACPAACPIPCFLLWFAFVPRSGVEAHTQPVARIVGCGCCWAAWRGGRLVVVGVAWRLLKAGWDSKNRACVRWGWDGAQSAKLGRNVCVCVFVWL